MSQQNAESNPVTRTIEEYKIMSEGTELDVSQWYTLTQSHIDQFAETTGDNQWIHVDVERARKESPFGGTIAHGYLTLSMLSVMSFGMNILPAGIRQVYNYGMDKVRFLSPVKAGGRIRNRCRFLDMEVRSDKQVLLKTEHTIEIEGESKPALISVSLVMISL